MKNASFDYLFVQTFLDFDFFLFLTLPQTPFPFDLRWKKTSKKEDKNDIFTLLRHWFWWKIERNKIIILHKFFFIPRLRLEHWLILGQHEIKWMWEDLFSNQMKLEWYEAISNLHYFFSFHYSFMFYIFMLFFQLFK